MRGARDRAESYCLRLGEAESQRDALRAHALKLDGLCERAAAYLKWDRSDEPTPRPDRPEELLADLRARGEVPR